MKCVPVTERTSICGARSLGSKFINLGSPLPSALRSAEEFLTKLNATSSGGNQLLVSWPIVEGAWTNVPAPGAMENGSYKVIVGPMRATVLPSSPAVRR